MVNPIRLLIYAVRYGRHFSFCQRLRRMITIEWIWPYVQSAERVLEVGGGDGQTICFLAGRFRDKEFVVCEKDRKRLEKIAERIAKADLKNVTVIQSSIEEYDEPDVFNFVFAVDVLEHIADDRAALLQMKDKLTPGGNVFLHVPARGVSVFDDPDHVRPGYDQAALKALLEKAGFEVKRMEYTFGWRGVRHHHSRVYLPRFRRAWIHLLDLADGKKIKSSIGVLATKPRL